MGLEDGRVRLLPECGKCERGKCALEIGIKGAMGVTNVYACSWQYWHHLYCPFQHIHMHGRLTVRNRNGTVAWSWLSMRLMATLALPDTSTYHALLPS